MFILEAFWPIVSWGVPQLGLVCFHMIESRLNTVARGSLADDAASFSLCHSGRRITSVHLIISDATFAYLIVSTRFLHVCNWYIISAATHWNSVNILLPNTCFTRWLLYPLMTPLSQLLLQWLQNGHTDLDTWYCFSSSKFQFPNHDSALSLLTLLLTSSVNCLPNPWY